MKYTYRFADGTKETIEISPKLAKELEIMDLTEANQNRKERYHCMPISEFSHEGLIFATSDEYEPSTIDLLFNELPNAISHLKPAQKEIIKLFYFEHKTQAEIAEIIGVSQQAISKRIIVAEKNLKKFFEKRL